MTCHISPVIFVCGKWLTSFVVSLLHFGLGLWSTGGASYINPYQVSSIARVAGIRQRQGRH